MFQHYRLKLLIRSVSLLTLFALTSSSIITAAPAADSLLLHGAKIVDPDKQTITEQDILISDGRVTSVGKSSGETHATKTIDVTGKWIVPGLVDLHVHCGGNPVPNGEFEKLGPHEAAKVMLYTGVVAYLDLATYHPNELFAARDNQRAKPVFYANEADIYCAGSAFGRWNLPSAAETPKIISSYIERCKPDVIKLIYGKNMLDVPRLTAAIDVSNKAGVKTIVHIGSWDHAADAIKAGATAVTHFFDDAVIPDRIAQIWAKSHTLSIPTMAVQCDMANFTAHPNLLKTPLAMDVQPKGFAESFKHKSEFDEHASDVLSWQQEDMDNDFKSFHKLMQVGVPMLAGSDTNNIGTLQGFSLHREMKLMRDAGYSNWQALAAGSSKAAKFIGRGSGIATGDIAELVVIDADPIADITNTQKISGVVHHGVWVDRAALLKRIKALR